MNYRRAIKRVIPLDVLQGAALKEVLARYAVPEDEFGHAEGEGEGDGGGGSESDGDESEQSSVSSGAFSANDPQRPPVSLSPTRLVNMHERDLRPSVSAHCHKKGGAAKASRSCHGSASSSSDDGSAAAVALAAATAAAAAGGASQWPSWVPAAVVPYLTAKWVAIAAIALALLYAGIRYYKLWRALGWQYALSAAFPFLRGLLCAVSGLDSEQVEAEVEAFQGGYHPVQHQGPPPGYHHGPPPPPPPGAKPAASAAAVTEAEEHKEEPKAEPKDEPKPEAATKAEKKAVTFSRDRVVALMVDRALAAPPAK